MTRIHLTYHGRYPNEKAASLFAAKSAEAFIGAGAEVTLIVPRRVGRLRVDSQEFYALKKPVRTIFLPTLDIYWMPIIGRFAHIVSYIAFSSSLLIYLLLRAKRTDWIYSNESLPLLTTSFFFPNTFYEVHDFPERSLWMYRMLFRRAKRILATNQWKADELQKRFGVSAEKIIVESNAVDLAPYENLPSRVEARKRLNLPLDAKITVYTGHLYAWKGVDTLAEAVSLMPEIQVYIVGGTEYDLVRYKARFNAANLHFVGHRPHKEMPLWQRAADVLTLPNTAKEDISARYTSPMKLFEYMASGTPVVASDIPSIREVAGGDKVALVAPDDAVALAAGIKQILESGGQSFASAAQKWIQNHSWSKRGERISAHLRA